MQLGIGALPLRYIGRSLPNLTIIRRGIFKNMNTTSNNPFLSAEAEIVLLDDDIIVTSIKLPFEGEEDEL